MNRAGLKPRGAGVRAEVCRVRVCGEIGLRPMVREPLVVGRVALEVVPSNERPPPLPGPWARALMPCTAAVRTRRALQSAT